MLLEKNEQSSILGSTAKWVLRRGVNKHPEFLDDELHGNVESLRWVCKHFGLSVSQLWSILEKISLFRDDRTILSRRLPILGCQRCRRADKWSYFCFCFWSNRWQKEQSTMIKPVKTAICLFSLQMAILRHSRRWQKIREERASEYSIRRGHKCDHQISQQGAQETFADVQT